MEEFKTIESTVSEKRRGAEEEMEMDDIDDQKVWNADIRDVQ